MFSPEKSRTGRYNRVWPLTFSLCQFPSGTLAASPLAVAPRPGTRDPFGDWPEGFIGATERCGPQVLCESSRLRIASARSLVRVEDPMISNEAEDEHNARWQR